MDTSKYDNLVDSVDGTDESRPRDRRLPAMARRLAWTLRSGFSLFGDMIVPPLCLSCRERIVGHDALCPACWREISFIRRPLCDRLGIPLPFGGMDGALISAAAAAAPPAYDRARGAVTFGPRVQRLLHGFKYADRHDARRLFGRWLADAGSELLADADLLVPVPLTRWRLARRQFNQAALLAREVTRLTGVPSDPLTLTKVRSTPPQVGLTRDQRQRNVRGAFTVPIRHRHRILGKHCIIIDDVITTGATMEAATRALRDAGAARVDVLAIALVTKPVVVTI